MLTTAITNEATSTAATTMSTGEAERTFRTCRPIIEGSWRTTRSSAHLWRPATPSHAPDTLERERGLRQCWVATLDNKDLGGTDRIGGIPAVERRNAQHRGQLLEVDHAHRRKHPDVEGRSGDETTSAGHSGRVAKNPARHLVGWVCRMTRGVGSMAFPRGPTLAPADRRWGHGGPDPKADYGALRAVSPPMSRAAS